MPIVQRESETFETVVSEVHWMDAVAKKLEKMSVEPMGKAQDLHSSLYDQISSIMGGTSKSKYPTVEAAVEDMKKRTGLNQFISDIMAADERTKKVASVDLFKKVPQVKTTIDNYLEDTNGNVVLPAVLERIRSIHSNDVIDESDWKDESLMRYITDKCQEVKSKYPSLDPNYTNLGKIDQIRDEDIDPGNSDSFLSMTPAKR